jgi:hypothetical protein
MGRGLSELQRTILVMAWENRDRHGLGAVEYYVTYSHPTMSFKVPDGARDFENSDRFYDWLMSRQDEENCGRTVAERMHAEMRRRHHEEMFAPLEAVLGIESKQAVHRPTQEEEEEVIKTRESIDDLGLFGEKSGLPVRVHEPAGKFPPLFRSRGSYADRREVERIVEALKARGFEAGIRYEDIRHADLYSWEVLGKVYGFERHRKILLGGRPAHTHYHDREWAERQKYRNEDAKQSWLDIAGHRYSGGKFYDVEAIGPARYNAAKVATSKAFHRLAARHLAVHGWYSYFDYGTGIKLTAEGVEVADRLMANRDDVVTTVSQYEMANRLSANGDSHNKTVSQYAEGSAP